MQIPQNISVLEFQTLQFTCLLDSDLNSSNVINKNERNQTGLVKKFLPDIQHEAKTLVSRLGAYSAKIRIRNSKSGQ